jgi:hypothetical protein
MSELGGKLTLQLGYGAQGNESVPRHETVAGQRLTFPLLALVAGL